MMRRPRSPTIGQSGRSTVIRQLAVELTHSGVELVTCRPVGPMEATKGASPRGRWLRLPEVPKRQAGVTGASVGSGLVLIERPGGSAANRDRSSAGL